MPRAKNVPVFLVGHVTKEGVIAGPKVVEHMVDAVVMFEGERHYAYRIIRAIKNRFGSTNEIGIFEMHDTGLREVENPSAVFLAERRSDASGFGGRGRDGRDPSAARRSAGARCADKLWRAATHGHRVRQQTSADDPCGAGEACRAPSRTVRRVRERRRRCAHR